MAIFNDIYSFYISGHPVLVYQLAMHCFYNRIFTYFRDWKWYVELHGKLTFLSSTL